MCVFVRVLASVILINFPIRLVAFSYLAPYVYVFSFVMEIGKGSRVI